MNWMAPEVLKHEYNERSDVWSLGCIILEMMTCHIFDVAQISGKLLEIKHNPQALLDTLADVQQVGFPFQIVWYAKFNC